VTLTTERATPLRSWNPGWGGRSTARRPVVAVNKLFPRPPVFVKRLTHEMTSRKVPGSEAQTTESVVVADSHRLLRYEARPRLRPLGQAPSDAETNVS
jgi:hypothetical protein